MADLVRVSMVMPGDYAPAVADSLIGQETTLRLPDGSGQPATFVATRVNGTRLTATLETEDCDALRVFAADSFEIGLEGDG